jgi:hypothetical protein
MRTPRPRSKRLGAIGLGGGSAIGTPGDRTGGIGRTVPPEEGWRPPSPAGGSGRGRAFGSGRTGGIGRTLAGGVRRSVPGEIAPRGGVCVS